MNDNMNGNQPGRGGHQSYSGGQPPQPMQPQQQGAGGYQPYPGSQPNQYAQPQQPGTGVYQPNPPQGTTQVGGRQVAVPPAGYAPQSPIDAGDGAALGSLICGIIAFIFGWTIIGGIGCGIAALVLAHKRAVKYKQVYGDGQGTSKAKEIAGRILGILGMVQAILTVVVIIITVVILGVAFDEVTDNGSFAYNEESGSYEFNISIDDDNTASDSDADGTGGNGIDTRTSDTSITPVEGSVENPGNLNDWVRSSTYSTESGEDHEVFLRITAIDTDQARIQSLVDAYNASDDHFTTIEPLDDEDLEFMTATVELYYPTDFPTGDNGIFFSDPYLSLCGTDGQSITSNGYVFIGLYGENVSDETPDYVQPGETVTMTYLFPVVKNVNEFYVAGEYTDADNEYVDSYIKIQR